MEEKLNRLSGTQYKTRWSICFIAVGFVAALLCKPVFAQSAEVSLVAPATIESGTVDMINLVINGQNIGAFELTVTCTPEGAIVFDGATAGTTPQGFTVVSGNKSSQVIAISGFMAGTAISSQTTIANISISGTGIKSRQVNISVTGKLYDPNGSEIKTRFSNTKLIVMVNGTAGDNANQKVFIAGAILGLCVVGIFAYLLIKRHQKIAAFPVEGIKLSLD
jgi:hypothetical protein